MNNRQYLVIKYQKSQIYKFAGILLYMLTSLLLTEKYIILFPISVCGYLMLFEYQNKKNDENFGVLLMMGLTYERIDKFKRTNDIVTLSIITIVCLSLILFKNYMFIQGYIFNTIFFLLILFKTTFF